MITEEKLKYLRETRSVDASDFIKKINSSTLDKDTITGLLNLYGVIRGGHFVLLSGLHSPNFIQFNLLAETWQFSRALAHEFTNSLIDVVATTDTSSVKLASGIADIIDADILINPVGKDSYPIESGCEDYIFLENKNVLLVTDIITSATGLLNLKSIINKYHGTIIGVAAFINRGYKSFEEIKEYLGIDNIFIACEGDFEHYKEEECPLSKESEPIVLAKKINFAISESDILEMRKTQLESGSVNSIVEQFSSFFTDRFD